VQMSMDALRCPPGEADVNTLSGGERRRVALCKLLLEEPDLLLLDEPTNHLDAESVAWLEKHLEQFPGAVLIVTHDRYFLDHVTGWILEIDRGRGIPYEGNYTAYLEKKAKRLAQQTGEDAARLKVIERERAWMGASPQARQSKSKARIKAYHELLEANEARLQSREAQIVIPPGPRLGDLVIAAEGLEKGYDGKLLIDDLSFKLPPGGIVGVIGPNGAGKTTLFRMLTGEETPDGGSIRFGETATLGYVDQSRSLDGNKNVWEEISGGAEVIQLGKREVNSRAYVGAFNFKGSDQQKPVSRLSGGERNRVHLAKMLKSGANVLLLDEPTNDLDTETLAALEEALEDYAGCAVVISHERMFLDRLATHILAFEGDSHVEWFEGNFEAYEQDKRRRLGNDATDPHRIRYKAFSR
jgi:ATP-binding cassette ChvD family protein